MAFGVGRRLAEADRLYREILSADAGNSNAWHLLGLVCYQNGDNEAAIECMRRAVALESTALYLSNLAAAYISMGQVVAAEICCREALALDPAHRKARYHLGCACHLLGKLDEAVDCYRHLLAADPNNALAWNGLGTASVALRNLEEAEGCFRRAI